MMFLRTSRGLALKQSKAVFPLLNQSSLQARGFSNGGDEVGLLEDLLAAAKQRRTALESDMEDEADVGPKFNIGTYNNISAVGLKKFPSNYAPRAVTDIEGEGEEVHAILLRSYKLKSEEVASTVRAIARCGAGTNNIPVDEMTARGIPVFNSPGANANAVKENVICALLLASRGIVEGIQHQKKIIEEDKDDFAVVKKRVEAEKKKFVGQELAGKTLGVVGLGHIGANVVTAALALGMNVIGYDPVLSVDSAWRLPGDSIERAADLEVLLAKSDYISLHTPYMKATHHMLNAENMKLLKPSCHLINFARGELIDSVHLAQLYHSGAHTGKYITDFPDENLHDCDKVIGIPHLGASTLEAEENSASMAAEQIAHYVETGNIKNSVNFPNIKLSGPLPYDPNGPEARLCIVNDNTPGVLGNISTKLGELGLNIIKSTNASRGSVAYTIVDVENLPEDVTGVQQQIANIGGVLSSRFIEQVKRPSYFYISNK